MTLKSARRLTVLLPFILIIFISACAPLKPLDLTPEHSPPPASSTLWETVGAITAKDWHVLLNNGLNSLDWRLRAIDSASENIDIQTFLWMFDATGTLVLNHLLDAADRGVRIRLLIDDSFLIREDRILLALAEHSNIEYRVFNPFKHRSGGVVARQLLNLTEFNRLDHRMHNKSMVIDNRVAIVGGRNLADEYFGLHTHVNFRDLELLLGGPIVQQISTAFDTYWNDHWSYPIDKIANTTASPEQLEEVIRIGNDYTHIHQEESAQELSAKWQEIVAKADFGKAVLFVDKPPEGNPANHEESPIQVADKLVDLIDNAKEEILIVSAYLIPTSELEDSVKRAITRGVRIRILTNSIGSNNHLTAYSVYHTHIKTLLEHGVELHEIRTDASDRGRYMLKPVELKMLALHAKALIIDNDKVFIGSANLDPRSQRINTEMGFLVVSRSFNEVVRSAVQQDFSGENSWQLRLKQNGQVNWVTENQILTSQPATSLAQRLEVWFFSHLPIEDEL